MTRHSSLQKNKLHYEIAQILTTIWEILGNDPEPWCAYLEIQHTFEQCIPNFFNL